MPFNAHNKVIHTAVAAPGAGKTEALIRQLPNLLAVGKYIVIAAPTIQLADSLANRCQSMVHRVVHSATCQHAIDELVSALNRKLDHLIITTHESIFQAAPDSLKGWTLVVDEVPQVLALPYYWFDPIELGQVLSVAEERDGQLFLREEKQEKLARALDTYKANAAGAECTSMLSKAGAYIFQSLLLERTVFIDTENESGKRCVRPIIEMDCWSRFSSAKQVHVLAANINGGLFDAFADVHEFTYTESVFTPSFEGYHCPITIYPLVPQGRNFSKSGVLTHLDGEKSQEHQGVEEKQIIDVMLKLALTNVTGKPLLFNNGWANFRWLHKETAVICSVDSRGLDDFKHATNAILLFGGNPSPTDKLGLEHLAKKYERNFTEAFLTTRLLETSLQAVTRTAIRDTNNRNHVKLFVQDERVAQYLKETYLSHAHIDWSLSQKTPKLVDGRKAEHPKREQVLALLALGHTLSAIEKDTGVTRKTIRKWRDQAAA